METEFDVDVDIEFGYDNNSSEEKLVCKIIFYFNHYHQALFYKNVDKK